MICVFFLLCRQSFTELKEGDRDVMYISKPRAGYKEPDDVIVHSSCPYI